MDVGPALIVCFLMVSMTAVKSQIREGPKNALKKVGDNVTLKCITVNKNCDKVDWAKVEGLQSPKLVYRHGQGMLNNDVYPTTRYSVNSTGGCSLTITQLEINDSGRFICMQAVGDKDETRSAILVVLHVAESCLSNVTSNELDKDDGYSLRCAINIPAKSVEPSNVTLSFHNKAVGETETTDENQPFTVETTLTGTARKDNITRVCRASFLPNTQANYDSTTAILDICTTQPLIVSWAFGAETPPLRKLSGDDVDGDAQKIKGDAGDKNTSTGYGLGSVAGAVIGAIIVGGVIGGGSYAALKDERSSLYVCLHSRKKKENDYPVANILISVSPPGPDKGIAVRCTADGHPPPTLKWTHLKNGTEVDGNTMVIKCDAGAKYNCTATNTVNGKETSQNITIEFTSSPPGDYGAIPIGPRETSDTGRQDAEVAGFGQGCVAGAVTGAIIGCGVIAGASYAGLKDKRSPRYAWHHLRKKKKNGQNGEKVDAASE